MRLESTIKRKSKRTRHTRRNNKGSVKIVRVATGDEFDSIFDLEEDGVRHPEPVRINPESKEDREKRLARRKARTIKAFQTTYENRRRKAS
jgi:hypothetical protein